MKKALEVYNQSDCKLLWSAQMITINVVMDVLTGGALTGLQRVSKSLPQYNWTFTTDVLYNADIVLYMNNHRHYKRAKELKISHIIQRKTGIRSFKVQEPDDLIAVICASKASFNNSRHLRKQLIYNGIDFDYLKTILPKPNIRWLCCESRHGAGQRTETSIQYAIKHNKHLTILGSGEGVAEDTYNRIQKKYPQCFWVGRVSPEEALSYIKGCEAILIANPSHGCANQIIEATAMDKQIIDLSPTLLEIPPKNEIDINITAQKYSDLIESIK